tara:strand:+ start:18007 stop:20187 length:2181 start_codon:yes stop_codon:yes gene_type:complete
MNLIFRIVGLFFAFTVFSQKPEVLNDTIKTLYLEEVKVSSIRAKSTDPITHTNLSKEEFKSRNLGQDIPVLLNFLPGVVTTSDAGAGIGYTGIRIRGSDATRVNVTLNGIPFNDSESQAAFWVNLPDFSSSIENIQLQRGVGTSTNGAGAFGASLNILTDAIQPKASSLFSTSYGSFNSMRNTLKFSTGILNKYFELSGRLSKIQSDGYINRANSNLKSYFLQASLKKGSTLIKAIAFGGHEVTYQSWYGTEDLSNRKFNPAGSIYNDGKLIGFYDNQEDNYRQDHYQFHWNEKINSFWTTSLGLNYTYGRGYYEEYNDSGVETNFSYLGLTPINIGGEIISTTKNVTRKWLDNDYYVFTGNANYLNGNIRIDIGILFSRYIGDHFGTLIWAQHSGNILPRKRVYENKGEKKEKNFYIKFEKPITSQIKGFLDLQYRKINYEINGDLAGPERFNINSSYNFFNPKAGITYIFNKNQQLYLSYSKAQREPSRADFENGNPKPEILNDFELGWRIKKNFFQVQSNLYLMSYKDQLALNGAIDNVGNPIRENIGKSSRFGIEIDSKLKFSEKWTLQPNISLSKNNNKDVYFKKDGVLTYIGDTKLSYSPELVIGNILVFKPIQNIYIGFLTKYVGEQYMSNIEAEKSKLDSYLVSDINISYHWEPESIAKEIRLDVLVNNVFNKMYISNGYYYTYEDTWTLPNQIKTIEGAAFYPQAGINFLAGITINF